MTCADYLTYDGLEIINTARAYAYLKSYGRPLECAGCDPTGGVYRDPVTDDAPWYDPAVPESADVLGFSGVVFDGVRRGAVTRSMLELANGGGRPGPSRAAPRVIRVELLVWARTDCALSYAVAWLAAVMGEPACGLTCGGGEMTLSVCCAQPGQSSGVRALFDVSVPDPLEEIARRALGCGVLYSHIELTVEAGQPYLYQTDLIGVQTFDLSEQPSSLYTPQSSATCVTSITCMDDESCADPPTPPALNAALDPCWSGAAFTGPRRLIEFSGAILPSFLAAVPVVQVDAGLGSDAVDRLFIRFMERGPTGCPAGADPCLSMAEWSATYMRTDAVLTFDGRTRRASASCQGDLPFTPKLYGVQGGPLRWPVASCSAGVCVEIAAAAATADTMVTIGWAIRQEAA